MPVITIRMPDELRKKTGSQAELERVEKGFSASFVREDRDSGKLLSRRELKEMMQWKD
ncbi:MAG: hypothetical protein QXN92_06400 [Archaeoglobaceae archaeon]